MGVKKIIPIINENGLMKKEFVKITNMSIHIDLASRFFTRVYSSNYTVEYELIMLIDNIINLKKNNKVLLYIDDGYIDIKKDERKKRKSDREDKLKYIVGMGNNENTDIFKLAKKEITIDEYFQLLKEKVENKEKYISDFNENKKKHNDIKKTRSSDVLLENKTFTEEKKANRLFANMHQRSRSFDRSNVRQNTRNRSLSPIRRNKDINYDSSESNTSINETTESNMKVKNYMYNLNFITKNSFIIYEIYNLLKMFFPNDYIMCTGIDAEFIMCQNITDNSIYMSQDGDIYTLLFSNLTIKHKNVFIKTVRLSYYNKLLYKPTSNILTHMIIVLKGNDYLKSITGFDDSFFDDINSKEKLTDKFVILKKQDILENCPYDYDMMLFIYNLYSFILREKKTFSVNKNYEKNVEEYLNAVHLFLKCDNSFYKLKSEAFEQVKFEDVFSFIHDMLLKYVVDFNKIHTFNEIAVNKYNKQIMIFNNVRYIQ